MRYYLINFGWKDWSPRPSEDEQSDLFRSCGLYQIQPVAHHHSFQYRQWEVGCKEEEMTMFLLKYSYANVVSIL